MYVFMLYVCLYVFTVCRYVGMYVCMYMYVCVYVCMYGMEWNGMYWLQNDCTQAVVLP